MKHDFSDILEEKLNKKQFILIYPEQEMWFNYKKPRPPKPGAYYYAAKNNVQIISCFVEMIDTHKPCSRTDGKPRILITPSGNDP